MDDRAPWREIESGQAPAEQRAPERIGASRIAIAAVAGLIACSAGAAMFVAGQQKGQVQVLPEQSQALESSVPAAMVVVEVSGAVARPGVYSLPAGSRVSDAIAMAGGYSADVDPRVAEAQLNLAAKLVDAQSIHLPRRGENGAPSGSPGAASTGLVNLNTASSEQLDTLPGIGPVTAQKIIAARQQQPFASVDDLVKRKIVSASTLAKLRSLVTV